MSKFIIYLIEDCEERAEKTIQKLQTVAPEYAKDEYTFQFELMKGNIPQRYEDKQYAFYDQNIMNEIETNIEKEACEGSKVGLLLDVMLTQEDIEKSKNSYYAHASISRDIFFKFKGKIPIYIVTISSTFAAYSDIIMGVNLSEQFINQARLERDPADSLKGDFERMFTFYWNYRPEENIDERTGKDEQQVDIARTCPERHK